jgi:hypothetical protein
VNTMPEFFSRDPDPLEALLRASSPVDNETLRQAVYAQTQRVLHRRRRIRQFAYAASLLLSFAVGAGVMRMSSPGPTPLTDTPSPSASMAEAQSPASPTQLADDSALEREWLAFDSENHRSELYRRAGDRYIKDENDLQSALRCYSNALDSGTEQDLAISPDDNWLLMAIKDARQKEKNHAKQGG